MSGSTVAEFYTGRSVLITGATGFMGKVLVEKLLRSCPGVANIYLLMRPKKGKDASLRLQDILTAQCFDYLRGKAPDSFSKLVPVEGDIALPHLGLSATSTKLLTDNVSIVFHAAATVRFDEGLRSALQMNVQGTSRTIELCHQMDKLVALVHVSTAYCNCDREEIQEKVYPVSVDPMNLIQLTDWMDDTDIEYLTPRLLGKRPNTYTFTKALGENVLTKEAAYIPYSIVRPSIVTGSRIEPMIGWVDNLNGPNGLIAGAGKGILRTAFCDRTCSMDIMPVDIAINLLISVAWYTATERGDNGRVYNCISSSQKKPFTWGQFMEFGIDYARKGILNDIVFYPDLVLTTNYYYNVSNQLFMHRIPGYILDFVAWLSGKKPIMSVIYDKMHKGMDCLQFFATHQWTWTDDNVRFLWNTLSEEDQSSFNFDISQINWKEYLIGYFNGLKIYVLKENMDLLPAAKKRVHRLWWLRQYLRILLVVVTWRLIILRSVYARQTWVGLNRKMLRMITYLPLINRI